MSFEQALSGLNSSSKQLDVIGNNVANASTVGFKQSQAQFADMFAVSLSGGGVQVGTGVKLAAVAQQFSQGNITNTNNPMDNAISGQGFFRLVDPNGAIVFSRNGQFHADKDGFLVNSLGHNVTGYMPNAAGVIVAANPTPIQISAADLNPSPTASAAVGVNLDSLAAVPVTATFDPLDPASYNNSTSVSIYDSLGGAHVGTLYFQRLPIMGAALAALGNFSIAAGSSTMTTTGSTAGLSAGNSVTLSGVTYTITSVDSATQLTVSPTGPVGGVAGFALTATNAPTPNWNVYLAVDGSLVPAAGTKLATLTFDALGNLTAPAGPPLGQAVSAALFPTSITVDPAQTVTFDFNQSTQFGGNFGVNSLTQDGFTSGRLNGFSTSSNGIILGRYSNGQSRSMGQMLLANFTNPQGLQPVGNNEWVETFESGGPLVGVPGTASLGLLQSSAVEESNVDLTSELVNMITAQRAYQANAQTIKTQDAVMQTLINIR